MLRTRAAKRRAFGGFALGNGFRVSILECADEIFFITLNQWVKNFFAALLAGAACEAQPVLGLPSKAPPKPRYNGRCGEVTAF